MARIKIGVVGAGQVGATTAHILSMADLGDVILSDIIEGMPKGKALDISQSRPIGRYDSKIYGTNAIEDMRECDIVVITAGFPRKPGMSREDLLRTNADIVKGACETIKKMGNNPILIIVTNPLDVMTYLALKVTGFNKKRVMGMAGVLDSIRFSHFISEKLQVSVKDINALVLGGHGDLMVPMPRYTTVAGVPLSELISKEDIDALAKRTANAGTEIVGLLKTGSAYYAPATSIVAMIDAIVKDENRILACAAYLEGEYGFKNVVIGVPVKLGAGGVKEVVELKLTPEEQAGLKKSADFVNENIKLLNL